MRKSLYKTLSIIAVQSLVILLITTLAHAQLVGAPAYVIDITGGTNNNGILFSVNVDNGARSETSDFGDATQGPLGVEPLAIAQQDTDHVLVVDKEFGERGALFQVDLDSGDREIISNFGDADQGPLGSAPTGVALLNSNNALVVASNIENNFMGGLFKVNLNSGKRTVVSDFNNQGQGPVLFEPFGIAVLDSNTALVMDATNNTVNASALFSINLNNGNRALLSNFGNAAQGPTGDFLRHVAIGNPGEALATDVEAGILFSVDTDTGMRTVVSNLSAQDPSLEGVALENSQSALVVNMSGMAGTLLRINLSTGASNVVTDFGNQMQGPTGDSPIGVIFFTASPGPDNQSSGSSSCALTSTSNSNTSAVNLAIMLLPLLIIGLAAIRRK